jgi:type I restriction enzyme S subunit
MMAPRVTWPTKRLGELAEFRNGVNYNKSSFGTGVKVVGVSDFQNYTKPKYDELDQINPEGIVTERNMLRDGDIVFVRSNGNRELIGRSLFIDQPPEEITHSAFTIRLRFTSHEVHPRFYAYCFRTPLIRSGLTAFGGGTNISNLNQDILSALEVPLPPLSVQRRIAGILSAYDELIENNQRRIQILETMARALYREWFVEFRFPGHEKIPRVASPLGEIPDGWKVKPLSDVCVRMESGGTPKRQVAEYWMDGDIDWFKTGELWDGFLFESVEKITARGQRESNARLFEPGTILMAIYGSPTVGRLGIVTRPSSCNQAALGIVADTQHISQTFLYFVLLSLRDHFNGLAQGAAQQNISKEKVANTVTIVPPRTLVEVFDRFAQPTFSQIQTLQRQVHNLRETRDLLLPRLLSGQVTLTDTAA